MLLTAAARRTAVRRAGLNSGGFTDTKGLKAAALRNSCVSEYIVISIQYFKYWLGRNLCSTIMSMSLERG